jgi:hypothetical protein
MPKFPKFAARRVSFGAVLILLVLVSAPASSAGAYTSAKPIVATVANSSETAGSLESAATKAGETGRKVAMSLIGLGFAVASVVLAFKRDFKEAAGIFAVGLVAILLASPTGMNVLQDTVNTLFGSS